MPANRHRNGVSLASRQLSEIGCLLGKLATIFQPFLLVTVTEQVGLSLTWFGSDPDFLALSPIYQRHDNLFDQDLIPQYRQCILIHFVLDFYF